MFTLINDIDRHLSDIPRAMFLISNGLMMCRVLKGLVLAVWSYRATGIEQGPGLD